MSDLLIPTERHHFCSVIHSASKDGSGPSHVNGIRRLARGAVLGATDFMGGFGLAGKGGGHGRTGGRAERGLQAHTEELGRAD